MTHILLRLFTKNRDTSAPETRNILGIYSGIVGMICNLFLCIGKLVAGWLSGSIAIIADGINNLSDAGSSIATLLGFYLARRPADADHPYGHARYEYLSGFIVAAMILLIGFELIKSSVSRIFSPEPMTLSGLAFAIMVISILVKLWMSYFFSTMGKFIHSPTLSATSVDSRNDVISTAAVLLSCVIHKFTNLEIDGYAGLATAVFVLLSGIKIARETISPLIGMQADRELVKKLSNLITSHQHIRGIHDLLIHDYGPGQCFASVHAELSADIMPMECHDILDDIERDALSELNIHLVIHYDPVPVGNGTWEELKTKVTQLASEIDPSLSIHDFRMTRDHGNRYLAFDIELPYDAALGEDEIRTRMNDGLHRIGVAETAIIHFDRKE